MLSTVASIFGENNVLINLFCGIKFGTTVSNSVPDQLKLYSGASNPTTFQFLFIKRGLSYSATPSVFNQ